MINWRTVHTTRSNSVVKVSNSDQVALHQQFPQQLPLCELVSPCISVESCLSRD